MSDCASRYSAPPPPRATSAFRSTPRFSDSSDADEAADFLIFLLTSRIRYNAKVMPRAYNEQNTPERVRDSQRQ
jgi:hypothetical protein